MEPISLKEMEQFAKLQRIENRSRAIRKILRNKGTVIGIIIILVMVILAVVGPLIIGGGYETMSADILQPPSAKHLFGTDSFGRDTFTRTVFALRTSLAIAVSVTLMSNIIGVVLGMIAGYYGRMSDRVIVGCSDILMAIPVLLVAVCIITIFGRSEWMSVIAITIGSIPGSLRIARGQTLAIKQRDFVLALKSMGISDVRIIFRHILPNVLPHAIVMATIGVGIIVIVEASLAYIGLGVPIPGCSLGSLIMEGRSFIMMNIWWMSAIPGIFIMLIVMGFNLFGDGLRDITDYHDIA